MKFIVCLLIFIFSFSSFGFRNQMANSTSISWDDSNGLDTEDEIKVPVAWLIFVLDILPHPALTSSKRLDLIQLLFFPLIHLEVLSRGPPGY